MLDGTKVERGVEGGWIYEGRDNPLVSLVF